MRCGEKSNVCKRQSQDRFLYKICVFVYPLLFKSESEVLIYDTDSLDLFIDIYILRLV